ncbi:hypothetical protein F0342_24235 [Bacillus sp. CH30_1T]|uniref:hypothetical protein n=1 Tax=Bacillus sp. CH30_1T TaxID=2604836 RepID=UPI0011F082DB|nr:hypothetical protein [Bacillus sp. CH30_1T]KAA0560120.1 hypothetical protein F0342_24235 [Bacillus sp. CH30_1T]
MNMKKGLIPSKIFGVIILLAILIFCFFIFKGESILENIKDGFTDNEQVSVQGSYNNPYQIIFI